MKHIVPSPAGALSPQVLQAAEKAAEFVRQSVPEGTQRAYAHDWSHFAEWCQMARASALPADPRVIAAYIADQAEDLRPATLRRRLAAISRAHKVAGHPNPCGAEPVPTTMKGIEARYGTMPVQKAPATLDVIHQIVACCSPEDLDGLRNRALLLVGYAGAFRRSELVALEVRDLEWKPEGVVIIVRKSKTDQRGEGKRKAIPFVGGEFCAATALKAWTEAAGIDSGPVFRAMDRHGYPRKTALSAQSVALIVKAAASKAGLDSSQFSGHSLRSGHVTEARSQGVSDASTMSVTGHKKVETLNIYDRRNNLFQRTSAGAVQGKKP